MDKLKTLIGNRLRATREGAGYTQAEIADLLKIERGSYTLIETGKNALRIEHLIKLCSILKKSPEYFLGLPSRINGLDTDESALLDLYRALPASFRRLAVATLRAWLQADPPPVPQIKVITAEPELPPGVDPVLFERIENIMTRLTEEERYLILEMLSNRRAARLTGETSKELASLDSQ